MENWLHSVLADCRFGFRQLRRSSGSTVAALLTLALGIGATTTIFSVIDGALLNPYPYKHSERLASFVVFAGDQLRAWRFPAAAFVDFREQNHTFEDMFGLVYSEVRFIGKDGTQEFFGGSVTRGTFESLGIAPLFGRTFNAEDSAPGATPVFVISYRLWGKRFHHDASVLGTAQTLNGKRMTLIGIMPPRFQIGGCELWLPLNITRNGFIPGAGLESNEIWVVGHLKPRVSPETAGADLQSIAKPFEERDPIYFPRNFKLIVNTLNSEPVSRDFRLALFAMMAGATMLLLISASNVANLLLARATTREKEFYVRRALGAGRLRLIRQLLIESLWLVLASCTLGCLFAFWGANAVAKLIPPETIPPEAVIAVSPTALLFCIGSAVVAILICGSAPALYTLRLGAQDSFISEGRAVTANFAQGRLRSFFVIAEITLSIVLAICSGLMMRSLVALQNVRMGFNVSQVLYAQVSWPEKQYDTAPQKHAVMRKILDEIDHTAGVLASTETSAYPPHTYGWTTVIIAGQTPPPNRNTAFVMCSEGYFQTLSRTLLRGAVFGRSDVDSARHVVVVNQSFVQDHFGEGNPLGHKVRFSDLETLADWPREPYFEIIGVVADAKNNGLKEPLRPEIYIPATLTGAGPHNIMVRAVAYSPGVLAEIRRHFSDIDSNIAIGETGSIASLMQQDYFAQPRFLVMALTGFAGMALLLVAVGVFSVVSYTVVLQTREIGIRMALGAQKEQVVGFVLGRGMRLIAVGIGAGLLMSYWAARLLSSQIWGVSLTDPFTFAVVPLLALVVGVIACLLPARRASQVDPMVALRHE